MTVSPALIWCPFGDEASARSCAEALLDEELVACANILPPMKSLYRWQGERGESGEVAVLFKTNANTLDRAIARLDALHPYDTPAILGWLVDQANPSSVEWLSNMGAGQPNKT